MSYVVRAADERRDEALALDVMRATAPLGTPEAVIARRALLLAIALRAQPQACSVSRTATAEVAASQVRSFYEERENIWMALLARYVHASETER